MELCCGEMEALLTSYGLPQTDHIEPKTRLQHKGLCKLLLGFDSVEWKEKNAAYGL